MHPLILAAAMLLGICAVAHAKTKLTRVDDQVMVHPFDLPANAIDEMDVIDRMGNKIGEVEEVLGPTAHKATTLAIDLVDAPGLRQDDEDILVPLDAFVLQGEGTLLLNADAKTIQKYEVFSD